MSRNVVVTLVVGAMLFYVTGVWAAEKKKQVDASQIEWEAKVPADHETSPYMLNLLMVDAREDLEEVPNAGTIMYLKGQYEIKKHKFSGLTPRVKVQGYYCVSLKKNMKENLPVDLAGVGPFYLAKISGDYYLITPKNFAALFGDVQNSEEALNYLVEYERLFVDPLACVVTSESAKTLKKAKRTPPRLSTVVPIGTGYEGRLIIYTVMHLEGFSEKRVLLTQGGAVSVPEEPKLIQKISEGVSY